MDTRPLVPAYVEHLQPYQPGLDPEEVRRSYGLDRVIKLASNENPLGPSPKAVEAIRAALSGIHRYPNMGHQLREVLASRFHVKAGNVIVGSGSEGILANIVRTFLGDEDEVLTVDPTFIGIRVLVQGRGVTLRSVPCRNWVADLGRLADAIGQKTRIIYLANPNNPTGTAFGRHEFEEFYQRVPGNVLIILDEAYMEYAHDDPEYPDSMYYRYDNVITLRTFSKAYGLAGVRAGYGFAHQELITNLLKVKLPFEPSTVAQAAGIAALEDTAHLDRTLSLNRQALAILTNSLPQFGFEVVPSRANFVLASLDSEAQATEIFEGLLQRGIIVRHMASFGLPKCLRISTGTLEEMQRAMEAIANIGVITHAASH